MTAERPDRPAPPPAARRRPDPYGAGTGPRAARPRGAHRPQEPVPTRRLREPPDRREPADVRERRPAGERAEPRGRRPDDRRRSDGDSARRVRLPWPNRSLRGLAGVFAGGLVALALGMVVVWLGAGRYGLPGPGGDVVIGHLVGAAVAVAGQRVADRRPDRTGTIAALVVVGLAAFVLGFAWFL